MKLYKCNLNVLTDDVYLSAYSELDSEKKARIDRCRNQKAKELSVIGDMLLKQALSDNGIDSKIEIYRNSKGKPYIKNSPYYFNISHSGDFCICAFSKSEIGVDIEEIRNVNLKTTSRFATEKELGYIFGKTPDEVDFSTEFNETTYEIFERFFEIWTLKEAYFKMLGTGISSDLKSVEFSITENIVHCSKNAKMTIDKSIDGYIISIAE